MNFVVVEGADDKSDNDNKKVPAVKMRNEMTSSWVDPAAAEAAAATLFMNLGRWRDNESSRQRKSSPTS